MKTLNKIAIALALGAFSLTGFAGSFEYGLTEGGQYSNYVTTTGSTSVVQEGMSTSTGGVVENEGPLGTFQAQYGVGTPPYSFYQSGTVAAGTYYVYLEQEGSGYVATSMTW